MSGKWLAACAVTMFYPSINLLLLEVFFFDWSTLYISSFPSIYSGSGMTHGTGWWKMKHFRTYAYAMTLYKWRLSINLYSKIFGNMSNCGNKAKTNKHMESIVEYVAFGSSVFCGIGVKNALNLKPNICLGIFVWYVLNNCVSASKYHISPMARMLLRNGAQGWRVIFLTHAPENPSIWLMKNVRLFST